MLNLRRQGFGEKSEKKAAGEVSISYETASTRANQRKNSRRLLAGLHRSPQLLDSSKATCAHFKHRFLLHHREGVELDARIFGASVINSENNAIETRRILTEHLIEDVGRVVSVEEWARDYCRIKTILFISFWRKSESRLNATRFRAKTNCSRLLICRRNECRRQTILALSARN
jgi:hypothetical protein